MIDFKQIERSNSRLGTLKNAPVVEAILAFYHLPLQLVPASEISSKLKADFPSLTWSVVEKTSFNFNVTLKEGEPTSIASHDTDKGNPIFVGKQAESNLIVLVQSSQTAVTMQRPYTNWNDFENRAMAIWETIAKGLDAKLTHFGVRFINQFDHNWPIRDYLTDNFINVPSEIKVHKVEYSRRTRQLITDTPYQAEVGLNFIPTNHQDDLLGSLQLDISIQPVGDVQPDWASLERLGELRLLKNLFFLSTINNETLAACNE